MMIDLLLALHGIAQQRGDGLVPELANGLRKMQQPITLKRVDVAARPSEHEPRQSAAQAPPSTAAGHQMSGPSAAIARKSWL
jgi:hypothetical protein